MIYLLLDRLSSKEAVVIQFDKYGYWLFDDKKVELCTSNHPIRLQDGQVLFLCDLNNRTTPAPLPMSNAYNIFASSPNQPGLRKMVDTMLLRKVYMDLWSESELDILTYECDHSFQRVF